MPTKTTSSPSAQPRRHQVNVPGQLLKYIPRGIVDTAAREFGVDAKAHAYSVWSHLAAMVFVQLAHAFGLNDVCDWLRLKRRAVAGFGVPPRPVIRCPMPTRGARRTLCRQCSGEPWRICTAVSRRSAASAPAADIDADGGLVLFFVSRAFLGTNFDSGTADSYIFRMSDADSLPAVINQPKQVDYVFRLPGLQGSSLGTMLLSGDDFIWVADGQTSARLYELPPFGSTLSRQPESFELTRSAEGDLLALRFAGIPGREYQLYESPNLTQWLPGPKLSAIAGKSVFLETRAQGKGFFKVMVLP